MRLSLAYREISEMYQGIVLEHEAVAGIDLQHSY